MTYLIKTKFEYLVKFLPNSRSRKVRTLIKEGFFYFPLLELNEEEFPLAFIAPTYDSRYKNEQIEFRSFNGQLYKPALNFLYAEEELSEWTLKDCIKYVTPPAAYNSVWGVENESEFFEEGVSVVVEDDKNERISKLFPSCAHPRKIMFDNSIWELTREPRYNVVFYNGFGGYHAPFVTVDPDGPFNANQFDLAVDYILRKSKNDPRVTRESLEKDDDRKIQVFDQKFVTNFKHEVAIISSDPVAFGLELIQLSRLSIDGKLLYSDNISKPTEEEYLSSLVFNDGELTILGTMCMNEKRLELVKDGDYYIARYKVDYFN